LDEWKNVKVAGVRTAKDVEKEDDKKAKKSKETTIASDDCR
jgi:hypothetical protein